MDRAGHADRTQKQRDETHQAQERMHVLQRAPEVALAMLDRVVASCSPRNRSRRSRTSALDVKRRRKLVVGPVSARGCPPARGASAQRAQRNVDARRQQRPPRATRRGSSAARPATVNVASPIRTGIVQVRRTEGRTFPDVLHGGGVDGRGRAVNLRVPEIRSIAAPARSRRNRRSAAGDVHRRGALQKIPASRPRGAAGAARLHFRCAALEQTHLVQAGQPRAPNGPTTSFRRR